MIGKRPVFEVDFRPKWNEEDIEYLTQNYSTEDTKVMVERLNRSLGSIYQKAAILGLKGRVFGGRVTLTCYFCGKEYSQKLANENKSKFCSKDCMSNYKKLPKAYCIDCGKELSKRTYVRCHSCNGKGELNPTWKGGDIETTCDWCNKVVMKQRNNYLDAKNHFCGKACEAEWRSANIRGAKCGSWNGGVTPLLKGIRYMRKYRLWRKEVFERDNYTCQFSGKVGGYLQVHHIKPFMTVLRENGISTLAEAEMCAELWDINNGITLSRSYHSQSKNRPMAFHSIFGSHRATEIDFVAWLFAMTSDTRKLYEERVI